MQSIKGSKKIHMVGIGGCSMSGLARILQSKGYEVSGSDKNESPFTNKLKALGIPVSIGHAAKNTDGADLLIYSAAIKEDNVERAAAKQKGIPQLERCDALGELSRDYKRVVGIAGCHGKTTITSMLAVICEKSDLDATVHVGGYVNFLEGGIRLGGHDVFITEACEYVESFLSLSPSIALINNIDDDHLDYFKDIDHITDAFRKFIKLLPDDGVFIGCTDDERVKGLMREYKGKKISYGLKDACYTPACIQYDENGNPSFDIVHRDRGRICNVKLNVIGEFNMINALGAAAVALELGVDPEHISKALSEFRSTRRRFELYGERDGVKVFHDYCHHPGEIKAVLSGAKRYPHRKMMVVFQCNSYSRAKTLFTENVNCFADADVVLVPDIYPGREIDHGIVHAKDMVKAINEYGEKAIYLKDFETIDEYLKANAKPGDIVVTLGSGDVYLQTKLFLH